MSGLCGFKNLMKNQKKNIFYIGIKCWLDLNWNQNTQIWPIQLIFFFFFFNNKWCFLDFAFYNVYYTMHFCRSYKASAWIFLAYFFTKRAFNFFEIFQQNQAKTPIVLCTITITFKGVRGRGWEEEGILDI